MTACFDCLLLKGKTLIIRTMDFNKKELKLSAWTEHSIDIRE